MTDHEAYRVLDEARKQEAAKRVEHAAKYWPAAAICADAKGLTLTQCTDSPCQLADGQWLVNLYPGNQRIYADRKQRELF